MSLGSFSCAASSSQTDDIEENIQYYFYSIKNFPFYIK